MVKSGSFEFSVHRSLSLSLYHAEQKHPDVEKDAIKQNEPDVEKVAKEEYTTDVERLL